MVFCGISYLFAISYFIISDIQCSERFAAKSNTVTSSRRKTNVELLQLINQETLIRFELDKNVRKMNAKVRTLEDRLNKEIQSINKVLSLLMKNPEKRNVAGNTFEINPTSTDSEIGLVKEEIKSLKQKLVKLEKHQLKLKTDLETDKSENTLEIETLKTNLSYFDQNQKDLMLNVTSSLADQVNTSISNINKSLLLTKHEQAKLSSAQTTLQHKQAQISSTQTKLQQKQATLSSELSALHNKYINTLNVTRSLAGQVNISISNINTSLLRTKYEQAKLSSAQTTLQQKQVQILSTQAKLQHKQTQTSSIQAKLQQRQATLSSELSALQNNYTSMIQSRKSQLSFNAGLSSYKSSLSSGETIIYQHVISNIGNAYNATTGIFTSPEVGTYVFFFSTYPSRAIHSFYLDMVLNGNTVVRGLSDDEDSRDEVSNLAVIHMAAGDRVWISCYYGCSAGISYSSGSCTSTFSGFML